MAPFYVWPNRRPQNWQSPIQKGAMTSHQPKEKKNSNPLWLSCVKWKEEENNPDVVVVMKARRSESSFDTNGTVVFSFK